MTDLRRAIALAACALVVLTVAACSGDDATSTGSPTPQSSTRLGFLDIPGASVSVTPTPTPAPTRSGRAVVQADLSSVSSAQNTITTLETVLQARLGDAGVHSNISQTGDAELTIDFSGARSADFVKQVIEAQNLNFRQPIITADNGVKCGDESGSEFSVPASGLHEAQDSLGNAVEACVAANGQSDSLEWQPAQAKVNGETQTLTQTMIDANQTEIRSNTPQGTVLVIKFDEQGTPLFAAVTAHLVSHPLGMFLGDSLLIAPTVQAEIDSGTTQISSASDDELAVARAVLKGGELPVPVTVTSIALGSPTP